MNIMTEFPLISAKPICPAVSAQWPEGRETSLYWVARRRLEVDARGLGATVWRVAADRHYSVFINGARVARQLNYFSGDRYLLGQEYGDAWTRYLQPGANELVVMVRSDPWGCKNYRPFHPSFWMESLDRDGAAWLATDGAWETAVIEGWREHLFFSTTQLYERVRLTSQTTPATGGIPLDAASFAPAATLLPECVPPPIYAWTDIPKETVRRAPAAVVVVGACVYPDQATEFDLAPAFVDGAPCATLQCRFDARGGDDLAIAATAVRRYRVRLNGEDIGGESREPLYDQYTLKHAPPPPARRSAGHYHYVHPVAHGYPRAGENILEIEFQKSHGRNWDEFRLAAAGDGARGLMNAENWSCEGASVPTKTVALSLTDTMSALLLRDPAGVPGEVEPFRLVVDASSAEPRTALIDFGTIANAFLSLTVRSDTAGRITVAYGRAHRGGAVDCASENRRTADILEVPAGVSRFETVEWRHFRYISLRFEGFESEVVISEAQAEESVFLPRGDSEWASDVGGLDRIWRASLRTAQLCGNAVYMDNPDREQAQWMDNDTPNFGAGYYCFGETRKPAKVLREAILHQTDDGQIQGYTPGRWHVGVPPYQCHLGIFAQACRNHFFHSGDADLGAISLDALLRLLDFWRSYRRADGLVHDLHTVFADWGSHFYSYAPALHHRQHPPTGALTTMNAYIVGALRAAADMARCLDRADQGRALEDEANAMAVAMRAALFDAGAGWFRDGVGNREAEDHVSQSANALAVWFGAAPVGEGGAILRRCFGADAPSDIIRVGPHFTFQAGSALFEAGCDRLALDWIRGGFGPMVAAGSETLWESFDGTVSLCQGTGSAVAYLLGRYVAGLYPVTPGYGEIGFDPQSGGLRRVAARLRTPAGVADVRWEASEEGALRAWLRLPRAWEGRRVVHPAQAAVEVSFHA